MPKITIYTTRTCPFCKMEKEYLDSKGVKYENFYVDQDIQKAKDMMGLSGQTGVPFTIIKNGDGSEEKILGFDKERLNAILGIK